MIILDKPETVITISDWQCPNELGAPLLTMPNIPAPLHGLNPRSVMGEEEWDKQRFDCYTKANWRCEICDTPCERMQAHEIYTYDYVSHTAVFKRLIALCDKCHRGIHSGRLTTMTKDGDVSREYFLDIAEHCFKLIHDYNEKNGTEYRLYDAFLAATRHPELHKELLELIEKYDIKFYRTPKVSKNEWGKWKLLWGTKVLRGPYNSCDEWMAQMEIQKRNDYMRNTALASA